VITARIRDPRAAFWLVATAFIVTMLGGALPTPLYPAYARRFGFGALVLTVVFAAYAVGVLAALVLVGSSSDLVGRRPVLFAGLAVGAVSSLVFLVTADLNDYGVSVLFVARLLSGASVGIVAGTATAALADFAGRDRQLKATLIAAIAAVCGLGLGALITGLLAQYVAFPLRTTYVLHLCLVAIGVVAVVLLPEPVSVTAPRKLRVQALKVPAQARQVMVFAGTIGFAGLAMLGLFTAVTPALLALLHYRNAALTGVVVFVVFLASAIGQVLSARLAVRMSSVVGAAALVAGAAGVGIAIGQESLALLVVAGTIAGAGQGLSFRAALGAVTAASPPDQRGAVASTFFAISYIGLALPVIGIGIGIDSYGLVDSGEVFSGVVAALALAALVSLLRTPAPAQAAT
jgi:MFS family permease